MKKTLASIALACAAVVGAAAPAQAAIVVSLVPSATHINVGESVSVAVNISGLGGEIASGYDLTLLFAPSVLQASSLTQYLAPFGGLSNTSAGATFGTGSVGADLVSFLDDATLAASQSDAFTLMSFSFNGLADGVSTLSFGLNPDFERNVVGLDAATLDAAFGSICIEVGNGQCTVPEPSTYALLGAALAGLLVPTVRRRGRLIHKA